MRKTFEKLAALVGSQNAYNWMREEGKIGDEFVHQLTFGELEDIFGIDGKEMEKKEKKAVVDLMAKNAGNGKEYIKMYVIRMKMGDKKDAENFLEMAKKAATLDEWAWVFKMYELRALRDEDYAKAFEIAKDMIKKEVFAVPVLVK